MDDIEDGDDVADGAAKDEKASSESERFDP
jgi:hypothetical protein